jgi:putative membrane protein
MQRATLVLLALHVLANLLWVGSLVSITRVITSALAEPEGTRARFAAAARRIYRSVSSPWMGIATLTGLAMIGVSQGAYFRFGWFHGKFTVALVMLGLHFALGARVRAAETHGVDATGARAMRSLQLGVFATATAAVLFVVVLKGWRT